MKAEKCEFHASTVTFPGYIIESGQVKTDQDEIRAVAEWPTPTTWKQLQWFLGFANFYHGFIWNFSRVAAPLTRITSSFIPFSWTSKAEQAFSELESLHHGSILVQPDPSHQFIVEVDASDWGSSLPALRFRQKAPSPCVFLLLPLLSWMQLWCG